MHILFYGKFNMKMANMETVLVQKEAVNKTIAISGLRLGAIHIHRNIEQGTIFTDVIKIEFCLN